MIYALLPAAVLAMVGYMFWRAAYGMRKERVLNQREATRGKHAFTRRHRARMLLQRAFGSTEDPNWQPELLELLGAKSSGRPRR